MFCLFGIFYLEYNLKNFHKPMKTFYVQTLHSEANKIKEFFLMEVLLYKWKRKDEKSVFFL